MITLSDIKELAKATELNIGDLNQINEREFNIILEELQNKEKDPLHKINTLVRDYCLELDFNSMYPDIKNWFTIETISKYTDIRILKITPGIKHPKLKIKTFKSRSTKALFLKVIKYYKDKLNGNKN